MAEKKKRSIHFDLVYLLGALLVVLVVRDLAGNWSITPQISYSEFKSLLNKHAIDDLVISDTVITGKYLKPSPNGPESFETTRVDDNLAKELQKSGIKFSGEAGLASSAAFCPGCCRLSDSSSSGCFCFGPSRAMERARVAC